MRLSYSLLIVLLAPIFSCLSFANQLAESSLIKDFEKAQKTYHEGSLEESRNQFLHLIKKFKTENLSPSSLELLHYALLRSAQLTSNEDVRKQLLLQAWDYSQFSHIDMEIFPPPLVLEYLALKSQQSSPTSEGSNSGAIGLAETSVVHQKLKQKNAQPKNLQKRKWVYWGLGALGVIVGYGVYSHNRSQTPNSDRQKRTPHTSISF